MKNSNNNNNGINFWGLLQIAFIVLKLCKVIDWNWWWVLSPSIFSVSVTLLVFIGFLIEEHSRED